MGGDQEASPSLNKIFFATCPRFYGWDDSISRGFLNKMLTSVVYVSKYQKLVDKSLFKNNRKKVPVKNLTNKNTHVGVVKVTEY